LKFDQSKKHLKELYELDKIRRDARKDIQ